MVLFIAFLIIGLFLSFLIMGIFEKIKLDVDANIPFSLGYIIAACSIYFVWTNMLMYNYIPNHKAERGIFFKDTAMLNEYRLVGSQNYIIFTLDEYSRSDRHTETIKVKVNKFKIDDSK